MGEPPDWYKLIVAAKYLGVAPWDLAVQPVWWLAAAQEAMAREGQARRSRQKPGRRR